MRTSRRGLGRLALVAITSLFMAARAASQSEPAGRPNVLQTSAAVSLAEPIPPAFTKPENLAAPPHPFWDRTNLMLFSGVAIFRGLDYASTRNMQARGREEVLLPDGGQQLCRLRFTGIGRNCNIGRPLLLDASHRTSQSRALGIDRSHRGDRLRRSPQLRPSHKSGRTLKPPIWNFPKHADKSHAQHRRCAPAPPPSRREIRGPISGQPAFL